MSKFKKGDRISLVSNPNQKGSVNLVSPPQGGHIMYSVHMDDGVERYVAENEIRPEVKFENAWDKLAGNSLSDHKNFTIATTISKVKNSNVNTISTLKASRTILKPYQFIPLLKFLNLRIVENDYFRRLSIVRAI